MVIILKMLPNLEFIFTVGVRFMNTSELTQLLSVSGVSSPENYLATSTFSQLLAEQGCQVLKFYS